MISDVFVSSYVHFHSLYCPLCTIITIICLIMGMRINVWSHLTIIRIRWVSYVSHLSWLFTIIEGFQHTGIWTTLWQYEVVVEDTRLSVCLSIVLWANNFRSIILKILHESGLSIIHNILRWLMLLLLFWIVESWCCSIWSSAETTLIHLILFVHEYNTVILLVIIASFEASIYSSSNWSSTIWKLTSCLFIWLV